MRLIFQSCAERREQEFSHSISGWKINTRDGYSIETKQLVLEERAPCKVRSENQFSMLTNLTNILRMRINASYFGSIKNLVFLALNNEDNSIQAARSLFELVGNNQCAHFPGINQSSTEITFQNNQIIFQCKMVSGRFIDPSH